MGRSVAVRGPKQIAFGLLVLATAPVVGWFAFSYHFVVGVAVSIIYGSAAAVIGTSSIVGGAVAITQQLRARREAKQLHTVPRARLVERNRDPKRDS